MSKRQHSKKSRMMEPSEERFRCVSVEGGQFEKECKLHTIQQQKKLLESTMSESWHKQHEESKRVNAERQDVTDVNLNLNPCDKCERQS